MDTEKRFLVIDHSVGEQNPLREHTLRVNGADLVVRFRFGESTFLPEDVAMKFVMAGFTVRDAEDIEIAVPVVTDDTIKIRIGPDEVVANLSELTAQALLLRSVALPDGERFLATPEDRPSMIAFLSGNAAKDEFVADGLDDLLEDDNEDDLPPSPPLPQNTEPQTGEQQPDETPSNPNATGIDPAPTGGIFVSAEATGTPAPLTPPEPDTTSKEGDKA